MTQRQDSNLELTNLFATAAHQLSEASLVLQDSAADVVDLHAAVDGVMQVSAELAGVLATVMEQAPAALTDHVRSAREILADLHSAHGCLTTLRVLATPARDDLSHLVATLPPPQNPN